MDSGICKQQFSLKKCRFLGCQKTDLKTVLYCQKCLYAVYNAKKPQNFLGAAPPDPCRSSLGGAMRHLARSPLSQHNGLASLA